MKAFLFQLFVLLFGSFLISMLACAPTPIEQPTAVPPTDAPDGPPATPTEAAISPATATAITPTTEPTGIPTPTPENSTTEQTAVAPSLIIALTQGVFSVAADGSGIRRLINEPIAIGSAAYGYQSAFSPDGRFLAYSTPPGEATHLNLLDIHSGETRLITPLLSAEMEPRPDEDCLGIANDTIRCQAAFTVGEVAWSPDGTKLAFVSAHAGNTADLYLYSVSDETIKQLSSQERAVSRLVWSPDSQAILYYSVHFSSGSGNETVLSGWAVRANGSRTVELHDTPGSQTEIVLGWLDAETIVVYSLDWGFCGTDLRTHNVRTGEKTTLWDGLFAANGVALHPKGSLLVSATCAPEEEWHLSLRTSDGEIIPILDAQPYLPLEPHWSSELNAFYANHATGWQLFSASGEVMAYAKQALDRPETVPPDALGSTQHWAWADQAGQGIWLQAGTSGSSPTKIFNERAEHLTWSPYGDTLFFFSGRNPRVLYVARAPQFEVAAVSADELGGPSENILLSWSQP